VRLCDCFCLGTAMGERRRVDHHLDGRFHDHAGMAAARINHPVVDWRA
jgi:hypothetical protein